MCYAICPILSFPLFTGVFRHNLVLRSFPFAYYHHPCLFLPLFTLQTSFLVFHPSRLVDFFSFLSFIPLFSLPDSSPMSLLFSSPIPICPHVFHQSWLLCSFFLLFTLEVFTLHFTLPFSCFSSSHHHSNLHSLLSVFPLCFPVFLSHHPLFPSSFPSSFPYAFKGFIILISVNETIIEIFATFKKKPFKNSTLFQLP